MNIRLPNFPFALGTEGRSILTNSSWNLFQQLLGMVSSSVVGILLIRVLSVEDFGVYSYAIALCSIGSAIMTAGLSGLAVKEIINRPHDVNVTVSALLLIREVFAVFGFVSIGIVSYLTVDDSNLIWAALFASIALFGRATDAPEHWYLANLRSKRTVSIRVVVVSIMLTLRLIGIFAIQNVSFFLAIYVVESLTVGALILIRYLREPDSPGLAHPRRSAITSLLNQSFPLMLSSVASQVNTRGNIVIIQAMLGISAVSVFSAATRISELFFFVPVIIMNSYFPSILRIRKSNGERSHAYLTTLQKTYDAAFWVGIMIALGVFFTGAQLINWFFGSQYTESKSILAIQVLSIPFYFMSAVYSKWIIAEGILWTSLVRHSLGAISNVGLCIYLIPNYGIRGAAFASFVSYVMASYASCFIGGEKNREAGVFMTRAIFAPIRYLWAFRRL